MEEAYRNAVDEIKRVDHLVYVSLKYSRTVDVIKSVIVRLVNCFDHGFDSILKVAKEKNLIDKVPSHPGLRAEGIRNTYPDDEKLLEFVDFYLLLKKILRSQYGRREEFRRHVTMITHFDDGNDLDVDIDLIYEYYEKGKAFLHLVKDAIKK